MKKLIKHTLGFYRNLIENNLSVIPIQEIKGGHKPKLNSWKTYQNEAVFPELLESWYSNEKTVSFGLVTGFSDVEAIDIDSKILPTKKERDEFLNKGFKALIPGGYFFLSFFNINIKNISS